MKRIIYTLGVLVAFSSCSTLNNTAYVDDAYYTPGDEPETPIQTTPETKIAQNNTQKPNPDPQIANPRAEEGYKKQSNDWGVNAQDEVEYDENPNTSGNTTVINNYYEDDYSGSYAYRFSRFGNVFYPDMYYSRGRRHYRYGFRPRLYLGWNNWSGWNAGVGFGSPWYGGYGNWGYGNWGYNSFNNFWPYHSHTFAFSNPYYGNWGYGNWGYRNNWGYNGWGFGNNWGYRNNWNRYRPYRNYGYNSNRNWGSSKKNNNIRMRRDVGTTNNRPTRFTSSKYVRKPLSPQNTNSGKKVDYQKYKRQRSSTGGTSAGSRGTTRTTGTSTRGTTTNRRTSAGTSSRRSTSTGTRTTTTNRRTTTTRRSTGTSTRSGSSTQRRSTTTRRSTGYSGRSSTGTTRTRSSNSGGSRSSGSSGSRRRR